MRQEDSSHCGTIRIETIKSWWQGGEMLSLSQKKCQIPVKQRMGNEKTLGHYKRLNQWNVHSKRREPGQKYRKYCQ